MRKSSYYIALTFLACQLFGLFVVNYYLTNELPFGMEPLRDEGLYSLATFIGLLAIITVIILVIIKLGRIELWKILYFLGATSAITVSLYVFVNAYAIIIAPIITWIKLKEKDDYWHNISEVLLYGGAVAVIAPMFNPATAIILLGIIALYDIYSVNYSKHMVKMAKAQTSTGVFPGLVVNKGGKDQSVLGGGDVAFPLLFASVFIKNPLTSMIIILTAFTGLLIMLLKSNKGKYYPAMPVITVSSLTGYLISLLLL